MKDAELANFIKERGIRSFVDYWEAIPLFSNNESIFQPKRIDKETRLSTIRLVDLLIVY